MAGAARPLNYSAGAATITARLHVYHLPQQAALHLPDLTGAPALLTGDRSTTGGRAGTLASGAGFKPFDSDSLFYPGGNFLICKRDRHPQIAAAGCPLSAAATENLVESAKTAKTANSGHKGT